MIVGIMQPYFFPYIGYFQLINAVETYVVYDDVNYIKRGWINRNNILLNGQASLLTLELNKVSQFKKINEITVGHNKDKLLKTISFAYKKAPYYDEVFPMIEKVIEYEDDNLSLFLMNSLCTISNYLNFTTNFILSSEIKKNNDLKGEDKILDICKQLKATNYINAIGGIELYNKDYFSLNDIHLSFLKTLPISYTQYNNDFIPNLSIIDVLMFNSATDVKNLLESNYVLI